MGVLISLSHVLIGGSDIVADLRKQLTELDARRQKEAETAQNEIKELQFKVRSFYCTNGNGSSFLPN